MPFLQQGNVGHHVHGAGFAVDAGHGIHDFRDLSVGRQRRRNPRRNAAAVQQFGYQRRPVRVREHGLKTIRPCEGTGVFHILARGVGCQHSMINARRNVPRAPDGAVDSHGTSLHYWASLPYTDVRRTSNRERQESFS